MQKKFTERPLTFREAYKFTKKYTNLLIDSFKKS